MDDNPHLDEKGKRRLSRPYGGGARGSEVGPVCSFRWADLPGVRAVDACDPSQRRSRRACEVFCGIDPGCRHMAAVVFCYLDLDDDLVVFDEIAFRSTTVREVCDADQGQELVWG